MTDTTPKFSDINQHLQSLDSKLLLGRICWYSVSNSSYVPFNDLKEQIEDAGFTSHPPKPKPHDVFKRACTSSERVRVEVGPNEYINYMSRSVGYDDDAIYRRIIAETVDAEGHRLDYTEVADLTFDRNAESVSGDWLDGADLVEADVVVDSVFGYYDTHKGLVTPYALREWARRTLLDLLATQLKDGVYFVAEARVDKVQALADIINSVSGANLHDVPLIDDSKQREMLKRSFEAESVDVADRLLSEMSEIIQSDRSIRASTFEKYRGEVTVLRKKIAEYSDMLDLAMVNSANRLEFLNNQLEKLFAKAAESAAS